MTGPTLCAQCYPAKTVAMGEPCDLCQARKALASERAARERAEKERNEANAACPCTLVEPCEPSCSCADPVMSGGCSRCCRYGSEEQRRGMAEIIVARERAEAECATMRKTLMALAAWHVSKGAT